MSKKFDPLKAYKQVPSESYSANWDKIVWNTPKKEEKETNIDTKIEKSAGEEEKS